MNIDIVDDDEQINVFELLESKIEEIREALDLLSETKIIVDEFNLFVASQEKKASEKAKSKAYEEIYYKGCEFLQKGTDPTKALNELINMAEENR